MHSGTPGRKRRTRATATGATEMRVESMAMRFSAPRAVPFLRGIFAGDDDMAQDPFVKICKSIVQRYMAGRGRGKLSLGQAKRTCGGGVVQRKAIRWREVGPTDMFEA